MPEALAACLAHSASGGFSIPHPQTVSAVMHTFWLQALRHPSALLEAQSRLFATWGAALAGVVEPPAAAATNDRRFKADAWESSPWFRLLRDGYQGWSVGFMALAEQLATDLDPHEARKLRFYARQFVHGLAPGNLPQTNPEVLELALRTGGRSLIDGMANLLEDLARGQGRLKVRQADPDALRLGVDIAATPGEIVYQNRLMQLIQYHPLTERVATRPVLIVPPWINKYYVLDLSAKRSLVNWLVREGHTVFVISWVNPDRSLAEVAFDDYLLEGTLAALAAIREASGAHTVNAVGYCIGGALLATTLAWLARRGEQPIASATLLTTLLDYSDVGEIGVFIDEAQLRLLDRHMAECGYLDGNHLGNAFNLLQENELLWQYWINDYLLGRDPATFDLLYWNADATRMPGRMHSQYLRDLYLNNRLRTPDALTIAGEPIDLGRITLPVFCVATERDHIAPWRSCYRSACLLGGPVRFVLGGSGHIAGIINPAGSGKYGYRTAARLLKDPERWLARSTVEAGSWWPLWQRWLARQAGGQRAARVPGDGTLRCLEPAPGSYVRVRVDSTNVARETGS
jgi:polyhydroxyalkanoate synthase subunit PhaC